MYNVLPGWKFLQHAVQTPWNHPRVQKAYRDHRARSGEWHLWGSHSRSKCKVKWRKPKAYRVVGPEQPGTSHQMQACGQLWCERRRPRHRVRTGSVDNFTRINACRQTAPQATSHLSTTWWFREDPRRINAGSQRPTCWRALSWRKWPLAADAAEATVNLPTWPEVRRLTRGPRSLAAARPSSSKFSQEKTAHLGSILGLSLHRFRIKWFSDLTPLPRSATVVTFDTNV